MPSHSNLVYLPKQSTGGVRGLNNNKQPLYSKRRTSSPLTSHDNESTQQRTHGNGPPSPASQQKKCEPRQEKTYDRPRESERNSDYMRDSGRGDRDRRRDGPSKMEMVGTGMRYGQEGIHAAQSGIGLVRDVIELVEQRKETKRREKDERMDQDGDYGGRGGGRGVRRDEDY